MVVMNGGRVSAGASRWALALGVGVFGFGLLFAPAAQAERLQNRGSQEDQAACTPDVFRLCFAQIPNEPAIVNCLISKKTELSPACRMVFAGPPKSIAKSNKTSKPKKAKRLAAR